MRSSAERYHLLLLSRGGDSLGLGVQGELNLSNIIRIEAKFEIAAMYSYDSK
jgi:hypothetical protein